MPRRSEILAGRERAIVLVGQAPGRVVRGVALTDGASFFEVTERNDTRLGGPWVFLRNMELGVGQWFRLEDAAELRIAGNAERIREKKGWPKP